MTSPSKPEELLEIAEKQAGTDAMQMLVDKHLSKVMELREEMAIADIGLLSTNIATNKRVDKDVKDQITSLHRKMRTLIEEVARRIENEKYKSAEATIEGFRALRDKEMSLKLLSADKKTHVSCQSLKVAVDLFYELNRQIVEKLNSDTPTNPAEERQLLLGNALLVYELTDFTINFIENFRLYGLDEIEAIHKDMQTTISQLRVNTKSRRKEAENPEIDPGLREQILQDITNRTESIEVLEKEWSNYMQTIRSHEGEIASVSKRIPSLRLIRNNAKDQIDTLAAVAVMQIVQSNIHAIEATVSKLEKIELASLSADRVKRLLGISH
jgi:hypothetical protein